MSREMSRKVRGSRINPVPAKPKLTDADLKKMRRRLRAGARRDELAAAYGVNRKTIQRRLKALELAEAERMLTSELEAKPATGAQARGSAAGRPPPRCLKLATVEDLRPGSGRALPGRKASASLRVRRTPLPRRTALAASY